MNDKGEVVNLETGDKLSVRDLEAMHKTVRRQVEDPQAHGRDHIKLSDIWQCTQLINKIQTQLVKGYTFDKDKLTAMVNAMFGFINGIVGPQADVKAADEVKNEEIVAQ